MRGKQVTFSPNLAKIGPGNFIIHLEFKLVFASFFCQNWQTDLRRALQFSITVFFKRFRLYVMILVGWGLGIANAIIISNGNFSR